MAEFEEIDMMTGNVLNKEIQSTNKKGTKIRDILKKVKCQKCGNDDYKKLYLFFVMINDTTIASIECIECRTKEAIGVIRKIEHKYYLLEEPVISTAG